MQIMNPATYDIIDFYFNHKSKRKIKKVKRMRKLLWNYFLRQEGIKILNLCSLYLLVYICMGRSLRELIVYTLLWGVISVKRREGKERNIPQGILLLPLKKKEREEFVTKMLLIQLLLESVIYSIFLIFFGMGIKENFLYFFTHKEGVIILIIAVIQAISCIHLMGYQDYMKKTDAWYTEMLLITVTVKIILIYCGFYLEGKLFTVYIIPYVIFVLALLYVDYKIARKHFRNMVIFYSDYEYSRGIKTFQL